MSNGADSPRTRLRLVELMGLAGAGKSTVFEALLARDPTILETPTLRDKRYSAVVAANTISAAATLVRRQAIDLDDPKEQVRMMMYVQALPRVLPQLGTPGDSAIVFDQGPLFLLTRHNLGGEKRLSAWWNRMVDTWSPLLDIVVLLDAPDDLLRERINTRDKWHALKGADGSSAVDALRVTRQIYARTLEAVAARPGGGPEVLRFDTSLLSADEIAEAILSAKNGVEPARLER